ncbi:MAG TPA: protein kinase [Thermoanaerobaculia bacterium]|nr:protein kinase [Thermoanaerobaculia bacterium]
MTIHPGTRLGPYEITALIGAGGMGEVYRGRDTRLDRSVAIKILPAEFADNAQLKLRFEREAKTISQLSHPNICALFDVGHDDGRDYLVMEFLEGETLAERLAKGALKLDLVLEYGIQIADALDKAHRRGVIHRDLKPSNVILTATGPKLVDFGLAKFSVAPGPIQGFTSMGTQQRPLTQEGTILGTLQYMAPEQLEGDEADARTDIFAFGAVLYEMLTGRRAFEGKTKTSLIAAIVDREPPSITTLQPLTPPALEHVIRRSLEKDPEDRWQSAHDVKTQLVWIAEAGSGAGVAAPVVRRRKNRERVAWALHPLTALAAVALTWGVSELREKPPQLVQTSIEAPPKTNFIFLHGAPMVSPDNTRVAYVAQEENGTRMLWVRPLHGMAGQPLAGTEGAMHPFWSPDSAHLGFFADGKLKRISAAGGPPQTLCEASDGRGGTWSRDSVILFTPSIRDGIFRVPAVGGAPTAVTKLDERHDSSHRFPSFLPDGRHFIYLQQYAGQATEKNGLVLASLDGKVRRDLVKTRGNGAYVSPGYLIFWRDGSLLAQRFDRKKLVVEGEPVPIAENVEYTGKYEAVFSVNAAGTLLFHQGSGSTLSRLVWVDRSGKELGDVGSPADYWHPSISHDGTRVAMSVLDPASRRADIWVHDLRRGTTARLTVDPADDVAPVWSPDDRFIAYSSNRGSAGDIYTRRSSGAGAEEALYRNGQWKVPTQWSSAAQAIVLQENRPGTAWDVWLYPLADRKPRVLLQTKYSETHAKISPNGKWLLYQSNDSNRPQIYVLDLTADGGKWPISPERGTFPRWSPSGREIFYWTEDHQLISVPVENSAEFQTGPPQRLFKRSLRTAPGVQYDVAPDGKRFLLNVPLQQAEVAPITLVQNWTRLLER